MPRQTRTAFLLAGGALLLGGASAAVAATEEDEALLRLGAAAELVAAAFYYRALTSRHFDRRDRAELRRARLADQSHYSALVAQLGPTAPVASDFDLRLPKAAFDSEEGARALGTRIERAVLGVHLTAASSLSTPELRALAARMAASEAAHVTFLSGTVGAPLPDLVDAERASRILAPYWG